MEPLARLLLKHGANVEIAEEQVSGCICNAGGNMHVYMHTGNIHNAMYTNTADKISACGWNLTIHIYNEYTMNNTIALPSLPI